MQLYSTKNKQLTTNLKEAVFKSLPADNGLYMPAKIPVLGADFIEALPQLSFSEIAFEVAKNLIGDNVDEASLKKIVDETVNFPAPVYPLDDETGVLELFHGPSLAFKDFGARFMSRLMAYFLADGHEPVHILVATSGDTGGAVALGFLNVPNIKVTILYPQGKVSDLQEKQLTTLGQNISAVEVKGTFDDCQALVKQAFLDDELNQKFQLSSANSINIARLIPQSFYYFKAYADVKNRGKKPVFVIPSGNFGNLTAGLIAMKMGLPVKHFIAATNSNAIVPAYLRTGIYSPKPSVQTIANAMDVGNPSNFERMKDLFGDNWDDIKSVIKGYFYDDEEILAAILSVYKTHNYVVCPHTATAYLAWKAHQQKNEDDYGVLLGTAHPCKFLPVYPDEIKAAIKIPDQLKELLNKPKQSELLDTVFKDFKAYLLKGV